MMRRVVIIVVPVQMGMKEMVLGMAVVLSVQAVKQTPASQECSARTQLKDLGTLIMTLLR